MYLRALSNLRGLRGAPEVPPLCRETQSLGQQMLNAPVSEFTLDLVFRSVIDRIWCALIFIVLFPIIGIV